MNSRSTLTTGMPAAVAFCATGVSASPSFGSTTSASGFCAMSVSIWSAWAAESVTPSAGDELDVAELLGLACGRSR